MESWVMPLTSPDTLHNTLFLFIMEDIKEIRDQAVEISELIEDAIAYYCNENRVSGQRAWFFVSHLANAHLEQFPEEGEV